MNKQFAATAAILEDVYDAYFKNFNTDCAWEVVSALNTEQKVVPVNVSFSNNLLQFEPEGRSGKLPPFIKIGVNEIQHFYQFACYDNCVVIAVVGREKPPHYQALAFGDVQTAVNFCDYLRSVIPGNQIPKPLPKPSTKTIPVHNMVFDKIGLGDDEQVEQGEHLYDEAAWFLENGYPVVSRKLKPRKGHNQPETQKETSKLENKSAALLNARHLQPNFRGDASPDFAALLRARRERNKADREPIPRKVCALCASDMQPEICEHCAHRVINDRLLHQTKARNKSLQCREFSTRMFQECPENTKTLRCLLVNGINSQNYKRMQNQRAGQRFKSTRNCQSYVTNSPENVTTTSFMTRKRPTHRANTYRAYSHDPTSGKTRDERRHQVNADWDDGEERAYDNQTHARSYRGHRSQERGRKDNRQVLYVWQGNKQEPAWQYSSEESLTSSSNSNEFQRYWIRQRPM